MNKKMRREADVFMNVGLNYKKFKNYLDTH